MRQTMEDQKTIQLFWLVPMNRMVLESLYYGRNCEGFIQIFDKIDAKITLNFVESWLHFLYEILACNKS